MVAHYAVPVKPTPARLAPAATLVLLRDRPSGGFDVLLMQRHRASTFAAGDFVFPGGKIEPDDAPANAAAWCAGPDPGEAGRVLGLEHAPPAALAYWIGVIRETFEEVGILLARGSGGDSLGLDPARLEAYRRACHADKRAFRAMLTSERLTLATDRLVYFAHWITPEESPTRAASAGCSCRATPATTRHDTDLVWNRLQVARSIERTGGRLSEGATCR